MVLSLSLSLSISLKFIKLCIFGNRLPLRHLFRCSFDVFFGVLLTSSWTFSTRGELLIQRGVRGVRTICCFPHQPVCEVYEAFYLNDFALSTGSLWPGVRSLSTNHLKDKSLIRDLDRVVHNKNSKLFSREKVCVEQVIISLSRRFTNLRIQKV